jgi:hypothetical protein
MAVSLGVSIQELGETLAELTRQGRLARYRFNDQDFFKSSCGMT